MRKYRTHPQGSHTELYVHFIWTTWRRMPFLEGRFQQAIYACIQSECKALDVEVLALGGVEDHIHLLVRMPKSVLVPDVAKRVKGGSSHLATHVLERPGFKWQESYSAFSVSRWDVPKITEYIHNQEENHRMYTTKAVLEPPVKTDG